MDEKLRTSGEEPKGFSSYCFWWEVQSNVGLSIPSSDKARDNN